MYFLFNTKNAAATPVLLISLDNNDDYTMGQATSGVTRNTRISAGNEIQLFTNSLQRLSINSTGILTHSYGLILSGIQNITTVAGNNNNIAINDIIIVW